MTRPEARAGRTGNDMLRVLQLSDTHLFADPQDRLLGQNTRRTLDLVLELVTSTSPPLDLALLTGDLVHDESTEGYRYLQARMADVGTPCFALPGNHDLRGLMSSCFDSDIVRVETSVQVGAWNLVLLDSTLAGEDGGHLSTHELSRLQNALEQRPDDPTLVCLHHQPVPVGSRWLDTMALDNPNAFFGIIDHHPQVRGILWGHVHQEFFGMRNGVQLIGSPSTCVQFKPGTDEFSLDELTPGLRWLDLHEDGRIDARVERIAAYPDPLEPHTDGY